ncbi:MAG: ferritin family protein [Bacillota bacterium]
MEESKYRLDLPYPAVTLQPSDCRYAKMISGAYAGKGSETTAISQYRVHALYLRELPDVLAAYRGIAASEVIHQELLGGLIKDLCCAPTLRSGETGQFWSGNFPNYRCELIPIFEADAQGERDAIAHYTRMIDCVSNDSIKALFRRIILDEELHLKILLSLIAKYK